MTPPSRATAAGSSCASPPLGRLTLADIRHLPTINVDQLGEVLNIGRNQAYAAVADGTIPSLRLGRTIRVPVPALLTLLGDTAETAAAAASPTELDDDRPAPLERSAS